MKYDLVTPCPKCPFRTDIKPFITAGRAREILTGNAEFACHATVDYSEAGNDEDGESDGVVTAKSRHCAGVLIILEKEENPHQMMRICEQLGGYDARKLKMDAPVYDSIADAVQAHRKHQRRRA